MSQKALQITCPCCQSALEIDVLGGKVLGWRSADETRAPKQAGAERWGELETRVQGRVSASEDKLGRALEREKTKGRELDKLFDDLQQKAKPRQPDAEPEA